MDTIMFYLAWSFVTIISSAINDKTKKEVLFRFLFMSIMAGVGYWYFYINS